MRARFSSASSLTVAKTRSLEAEDTGVAKIRAATANKLGTCILRSYQKFLTA